MLRLPRPLCECRPEQPPPARPRRCQGQPPSLASAVDKSASLYEAAESAGGPFSSRAVKALKDCRDVLRDVLGNTEYSMSQLREMRRGPAASVMGTERRLWVLSNAHMYMSSALTKEDTCIDRLKEMGVSAKSVGGLSSPLDGLHCGPIFSIGGKAS